MPCRRLWNIDNDPYPRIADVALPNTAAPKQTPDIEP